MRPAYTVKLTFVPVLAATLFVTVNNTTFASDIDPPAPPKIDCTKPSNKNKPACTNKHGELSDDEIYNAAYWLSRQGQFAYALDLLRLVANENEPRVLTAIGFATRKLGDVDGAMPYYARALALNPNSTRTREYLGEAYLSQGDLMSAKLQLIEIERRCGRTCAEYADLAARITDFEQSTH